MTVYVLADDAQTDLREIIRYTNKQWGEAQTRSYIAQLKQGMTRLATGQGVFKDLSEVYPALCTAHCGRHFIFCLPREDAPALIVAIFHERMDLMVRLGERLRSA
jgi:plasmid stabilization system protein ParE